MSVRNKIRKFVDSRGISVYRFRKETKIAQATAYELYNNPEHLPSPRVLEAICNSYEVQPGDLLEWVKMAA